jgi:hypothetical protein
MNNELTEISGKVTFSGIEILFRNRSYTISYPQEIWKVVPTKVKEVLLDNLVYAATMHLPMKFKNSAGLSFSTNRPLFEPYFFQNFIRDIPSCCDMDELDISSEIKLFLSKEYNFKSEEIRLPEPWPEIASNNKRGALVPLSLGKDSLLTFAVAEELGLDPYPVFVDEPGFSQERMHKEILGAKFNKEFGKKLNILEHDTGLLRDDHHLGISQNEYGWGLQSTEYALMMLPYARATDSKYIFFGNEQTAGSSYKDSSGKWTVYPCYDQTHLWTRHIDAMTASLTEPSPVRTGSLIEPLMDMMIQRILVNRYPRYAAYQMSCFAEGEEGKHNRWCHNCSICAKMYLMCVGGGVDPALIGLDHSMLTEDHIKYFPIFGGTSEFPYARTDIARDEHLFAFFCADRFGAEDPLVKKFRNSPLAEEAARREKELFNKFISLYKSVSLPEELKDSVLKIYNDEINGFTRLYEGK